MSLWAAQHSTDDVKHISPLNTDHYFAIIPTELMKEFISKFGINVIDHYHLLNTVPKRKQKLMKYM